jgi:hypothetical protein
MKLGDSIIWIRSNEIASGVISRIGASMQDGKIEKLWVNQDLRPEDFIAFENALPDTEENRTLLHTMIHHPEGVTESFFKNLMRQIREGFIQEETTLIGGCEKCIFDHPGKGCIALGAPDCVSEEGIKFFNFVPIKKQEAAPALTAELTLQRVPELGSESCVGCFFESNEDAGQPGCFSFTASQLPCVEEGKRFIWIKAV